MSDPVSSKLPRRKRVAFSLLTVAITLGTLELGLRVAVRVNDRVAELLSSGSRVPLPDPVLGVRPNPALPDHDSAGWRNPERLDHARIVAIGDSQTWGMGVSRENTWPSRLEAHTGRATYNISLGGYGGAQYALLADEALELQPDLVLVGLYAGNDLADTYRAVYGEGLAPELRSSDPAVLEALERAEATLPDLAEGWLRTRASRRGKASRTYHAWLGDRIEKLKLYALVRAMRAVLDTETGGRRKDADKTDWERYVRRIESIEPDLLFPFRDGEVATVLTPEARRALVDTEDPRVDEGLRAAVDAVRLIRERAAGRAEVAVVLIPTKELVYAERVRASGAPTPPSYDAVVEAETRMWEKARAALDEVGIPWIDTTEALRSALDEDRNPYQMNWDGHPNVTGYDAIARTVAASPLVQTLEP